MSVEEDGFLNMLLPTYTPLHTSMHTDTTSDLERRCDYSGDLSRLVSMCRGEGIKTADAQTKTTAEQEQESTGHPRACNHEDKDAEHVTGLRMADHKNYVDTARTTTLKANLTGSHEAFA